MVSKKHRRLQRKQKRTRVTEPVVEKKTKRSGFDKFYHDNYKPLFLVTLAMLLFAFVVIGITYASTGDIFYKGVSLSGGITLTIPTGDAPLSTDAVAAHLESTFPSSDFAVREISELGTQTAIVIEASPPDEAPDALVEFEGELLDALESFVPTVHEIASTEIVGSSLGMSFFKQTAKAVLIAFTFMGLVVFLYFGETKTQKAGVLALTLIESLLIWFSSNPIVIILAVLLGAVLIALYVKFSIPSAAVILAAVSTIIFTVSIVNLLEMRISTAGIAAFLMLIGYSVDTDILLSTRIKGGAKGTWPSPEEAYRRLIPAIKTGLTMEFSTLAVSLVGLIFTQSEVIKEIMTIIFIGLLADILFTWIQNVGLLRWWIEQKAVRK